MTALLSRAVRSANWTTLFFCSAPVAWNAGAYAAIGKAAGAISVRHAAGKMCRTGGFAYGRPGIEAREAVFGASAVDALLGITLGITGVERAGPAAITRVALDAARSP